MVQSLGAVTASLSPKSSTQPSLWGDFQSPCEHYFIETKYWCSLLTLCNTWNSFQINNRIVANKEPQKRWDKTVRFDWWSWVSEGYSYPAVTRWQPADFQLHCHHPRVFQGSSGAHNLGTSLSFSLPPVPFLMVSHEGPRLSGWAFWGQLKVLWSRQQGEHQYTHFTYKACSFST